MTRPAEVWEKMKPFVMADLGDLLDEFGAVDIPGVGAEEKDILLYDISADAIFHYDYSETGLLAAFNDVGTGDTIYVPAGSITLTESVNPSAEFLLLGAGQAQTYIYGTGSFQYLFSGSGGRYRHMANIYIDYTSSYAGAGSTYTVWASNQSRFINCNFGMFPSGTTNTAGALLISTAEPSLLSNVVIDTYRNDTGIAIGLDYNAGDNEEDNWSSNINNVVATAVNSLDGAGSGDAYGAKIASKDSNAPNSNAYQVNGLIGLAYTQNTSGTAYGIQVSETGSGDMRVTLHGCDGYAFGGKNCYGIHATSTNSKVRLQDCYGYARPTEASGTSYGIGLHGGIHLMGSTGEYDTSVSETGYGIYSDGSNTITHSTAIGLTNDLYINSGTTSVYAVQYDNRGGSGSIAHLGGDLAPGGSGATGTLFTQTASATVANTVTETTLVSTGVGSATLPANFFKVGRTVRIKMRGYNSTTAAAGTITMRVKLGSTVIVATPTNTATNNLSNRGWGVEADITCRTTGASGTVFGQGKSYRSTGAGTSNHWMMTATSTSTIDTTATQAVSVTVQWGTASASNTITATNFTIEVLN